MNYRRLLVFAGYLSVVLLIRSPQNIAKYNISRLSLPYAKFLKDIVHKMMQIWLFLLGNSSPSLLVGSVFAVIWCIYRKLCGKTVMHKFKKFKIFKMSVKNADVDNPLNAQKNWIDRSDNFVRNLMKKWSNYIR